MLDDVKRFDMKKPPMRQHLKWLIWILSMPAVWAHKNQLTKINMKGIKPPYLLLCNHNAFMDFKVATKAIYPMRANYVVAIDGFTIPPSPRCTAAPRSAARRSGSFRPARHRRAPALRSRR